MKYVIEIIYIVIFAIIIAFLYNYFLPNPTPLIYEKKVVEAINDSLLFTQASTYDEPNLTTAIDSTLIKQSLLDSLLKDSLNKLAAKTKTDTVINKQDIKEAHLNLNKTITYEQMKRIIGNKDFIIIDARSPENYNKEHIKNAINIFPYGDENEMMSKILELPLNKKIVVYCDGGNCDSSHKLAENIIAFGYSNVYIYSGGWEEWILKRSKSK